MMDTQLTFIVTAATIIYCDNILCCVTILVPREIVTFAERCCYLHALIPLNLLTGMCCLFFSLQISCTKVLSSWSVDGNVDSPLLDMWLRMLGQIRGIRYMRTL